MEEWKTYRVGDLVSFQNGFAFKSSDFLSEGMYPVIKIKEIKEGKVVINNDTSYVNDALTKYKIKKDDILFALTGDPVGRPNPGSWVGRVARYGLDEYAFLNQRVCKLSGYKTDLINPKYIYYYFLLHENHYALASKATGSASQANISTKTIEDVEIAMPCLRDQNRIVSILNSIDEKIELNNRINHNLEDQAQAFYKSWFVDYDPFKEGKFVESELGMIPEGWHVCKLDTLADTVSGYSYKGQELVESNTAMATIKNFDRNGGFKVDGYKEIEPTKAKEEHYLTVFDLLVAHTDLTQAAEIIGNPALVLSKGKYEKLIMSMDLCKVKSRFTEISNSLLYCILKDRGFKSHALGYVNGTTVLHMSRKAIGEYKIAIPGDLSILKRLSTSLDAYFQKEAMTIVENDNLETLRNKILPRLMSGELKINETDC